MPHSQQRRIKDRAREALTKLGEAVSSIPMKELTAPIEKEIGLSQEKAHRSHIRFIELRDEIEDLALRAALANPEAIRKLQYLGRCIEGILSELGKSSRLGAEDDSQRQIQDVLNAEDDLPGHSAGGCCGINAAASELSDILTEGNEELMRSLRKIAEGLPTAHFSFPLEGLLELEGPPSEALTLVSEICDRLVQERLNNACKRALGDLEARSNLSLDLPPGWDAKSRKDDGPSNLVRPVFIALENERGRFRSEAQLEEIEAGAAQWLSPKDFITKIEETWKAHQYQHFSGRSKMMVDGLVWPIMRHKVWTERAAMLPPLSSDTAVISKWADAGLFWIIAQHDGLLKNVEWRESIERRIANAGGSVHGGLRTLLVEGLETLAGKDRKGEKS